MVGTKTVADILTATRFFLGLYLVWLGFHGGPEVLATATLILIAAWATDVLDGPLARRDPRGIHTWIGDRDLEADMTVALGTWIYLALAGFISIWLVGAYVLITAAALWYFNSVQLAGAVQAVSYGAMIWTVWRMAPTYGLLFVVWIGLVLVVTWPRFPQRLVPEFLEGMREFWRGR